MTTRASNVAIRKHTSGGTKSDLRDQREIRDRKGSRGSRGSRDHQDPRVSKDHPERVRLKEDRCKHWLSVGAQPTDRVARFFDAAGLLTREPRVNPKKGLPGKKRREREEAAAAAAAEAAGAASAAADDAAGGEEAAASE